jgi:BolA protein
MRIGHKAAAHIEDKMTTRRDRIWQTLHSVFQPESLEIIDESSKHASHAARSGLPPGETHYRVVMVAECLHGQTRLARSRAVHVALDAEFKSGLHALSLSLRTPYEIML